MLTIMATKATAKVQSRVLKHTMLNDRYRQITLFGSQVMCRNRAELARIIKCTKIIICMCDNGNACIFSVCAWKFIIIILFLLADVYF